MSGASERANGPVLDFIEILPKARPSIHPSAHYAFSFSAVSTCLLAPRGQYLLMLKGKLRNEEGSKNEDEDQEEEEKGDGADGADATETKTIFTLSLFLGAPKHLFMRVVCQSVRPSIHPSIHLSFRPSVDP